MLYYYLLSHSAYDHYLISCHLFRVCLFSLYSRPHTPRPLSRLSPSPFPARPPLDAPRLLAAARAVSCDMLWIYDFISWMAVFYYSVFLLYLLSVYWLR